MATPYYLFFAVFVFAVAEGFGEGVPQFLQQPFVVFGGAFGLRVGFRLFFGQFLKQVLLPLCTDRFRQVR